MSRARLFLIAAAALFLGWIAWLGYAVFEARYAPEPPVVVSRAQLTAATHLVVAEVAIDGEGNPVPTPRVVEVLRGDGPAAGSTITVLRLSSAKPPGAGPFPGPGVYLLPLVGEGSAFSIAGLPRSPGYEPGPIERPPIYSWNEDTRAQLRGLGLIP